MKKRTETFTVDTGNSPDRRQLSTTEARQIIRGHLNASQYAQAASISMELADQLPDTLWPHLHAAEALLMQQQIEAALRYINRALEIEPTHVPSLIIKSRLHLYAGDREQALHFMDSAVGLAPEDSSVHYEHAELLSDTGDIDGACEGFRKSIALDFRNTGSLLSLSRLPKGDFDEELIKKVEFLVQSHQLHGEKQIEAHFSLAHAYDKKADVARHFEHLTKGNRLKSHAVKFDPAVQSREIQLATEFFSREFFAQKIAKNGNSARIIFITGFPRCGSTLVEQILSSHPDVSAEGETFALTQAVQSFAQSHTVSNGYPYWIGGQPADALSAISDDYMQRVKNPHQRICVTDKLLANYMFAGLIHLIFPNAKIIDVQRNPIDVCYSCYKRLFKFSSVPYTYDLEHLASHYRGYRRMVTHWNEVLPGRIHTVEYEQLVERQEDVTRNLLAHCELPWDDACMNFHKNERSVHTHSNAQVRQKLYSDSIDRWKVYADYLGPLMQLTNS